MEYQHLSGVQPALEDSYNIDQLNQERLELIEMRKQRKKVQLLTEELTNLENMYTYKVEQNIEMKGCIKQLRNLVELFESEKNQAHMELDITKQRLSNYITESQKLYLEKEQLKGLLERQRIRYLENEKMVHNKIHKLQSNIEDMESRLNRKDRESTRVSSININNEEAMRIANQKILLVSQEIQEKDIALVRFAGQLKIQKDENSSLKERLKNLNESVRQLTQRCRQLEIAKERTTDLLGDQMRVMEKEHANAVEQLSREASINNHASNSKMQGSRQSNYMNTVRNQISMLKAKEIQKIDNVIHQRLIRTNGDMHLA